MNLETYTTKGFSRGASRLKEAAWIFIRLIFFLPAVPFPTSLRVALLRGFGSVIGRGVVIRSGVNISFPWRLRVGDHVWIGEGVRILSLAEVTIGSNVCLSQEVFLCTGTHDFRRDSFDLITRPISVESGVWIAARAFVGPGVKISDKAVVAAGAVIVKDVPAHSLALGNPAQIKPRSE